MDHYSDTDNADECTWCPLDYGISVTGSTSISACSEPSKKFNVLRFVLADALVSLLAMTWLSNHMYGHLFRMFFCSKPPQRCMLQDTLTNLDVIRVFPNAQNWQYWHYCQRVYVFV